MVVFKSSVIMKYKVMLSLLIALVVLCACGPKNDSPSGIYQSTSYNTGKKVLFDFRKNGDVYVQVSHVKVSDKIVDDAFFPFFTDGEQKYHWKMGAKGRFVSIHNETDFEIVKLEYKGKYLAWDKTRFTRE
jgi:hypothetical protein